MAKPPKAVREAAERAEQLHQATYASQPSEEPEEEQEGVAQEGVEQPSNEAESPTEQEGAEQPPAEPEPEPEPNPLQAELDKLKQRYATLQGKYNAEVPQIANLQRTVREQADQIMELTERLETMTSSASDDEGLVTDDEKEEYGEDFIQFVRRLVRQDARRELQNLTPKIENLEGEVRQTRAQTAQQRVYATLDQQVTGWRQVNTDPDFHEWLAEEDVFSGQTRKDALMAAFNSGDARRVVGIFQSYTGVNQPSSTPDHAPESAPKPAPQTGKRKLEELAGPAAAPSAVSAPNEKPAPKTWTGREIEAFYKRKLQGKVSAKEAQRIEAEIGRAMREGRITGS